MTQMHFMIMEEAYVNTVGNLQSCIKGSLKGVFLEIFEHELRIFKQINFDGLVADTASLLLPVSTTPLSGIALSKRLPSGEAEKIQKAVQAFLVLRELKYTLLKRKDDKLPFREVYMPSLRTKDTFTFPTSTEEEDSKFTILPCTMPVGPTKKKLQRFLLIESGFLLIIEPDARNGPKSSPVTGQVCSTIPLQNIEMEIDKTDQAILHLTSHTTTSQFLFTFNSTSDCEDAQKRLDKARKKVRSNKMRQLKYMLQETESYK
eukprot:TRINITY_DN12439_c0_g1_i1.p1 TRINITY_DN12439_c0_g1~~TRINITY_DN12439_c0_g1_i1.p1  ORF type:complete len:276 (-),score=49.44 TRINITY_DN12439_c0_g1_i1:4-786(-)